MALDGLIRLGHVQSSHPHAAEVINIALEELGGGKAARAGVIHYLSDTLVPLARKWDKSEQKERIRVALEYLSQSIARGPWDPERIQAFVDFSNTPIRPLPAQAQALPPEILKALSDMKTQPAFVTLSPDGNHLAISSSFRVRILTRHSYGKFHGGNPGYSYDIAGPTRQITNVYWDKTNGLTVITQKGKSTGQIPTRPTLDFYLPEKDGEGDRGAQTFFIRPLPPREL